MIRGHLVTTARYALGFLVSLAAFGTLGACGGRYELGEDEQEGGAGGTSGTGGAGGTSGEKMTGGAGGASGGTGGTVGGSGGKGSGGSVTTGGTGGGDVGGTENAGGQPSGLVAQIRAQPPAKLDLLLMVDNSISMKDKQRLLADAMPYLLRRLTTPDCVDANGAPLGSVVDALGACAEGTPEFRPVTDIHIGVITSSLGDHGSGDICSEASNPGDRNYDDRAQLLPTVRTGLPGSQPLGFLSWDPAQKVTDPPGITDQEELFAAVSDHVLAAGEKGCGYEASLESWYRFLVDPDPVGSMMNDSAVSVRGPLSMMVLAQRQAFLRPDSRVAIVMLSDENDCSILDESGSQGWLVPYKGGIMANSWRMPRATSACATDPNSPDCAPCVIGSEGDPACQAGANLTANEDSPNLRCFRQKQRFGVDLLYPTSRYAEALSSLTIDPRMNGTRVVNPLYAASGVGPRRDPGSVLLMGIVGVPWQDLATEESLDGTGLTYMTASELTENDRWDMIVGNAPTTLPRDPLMVESVEPRPEGAPHPILGADGAIVGPGAGSSAWNPINGHEHLADQARYDLQHACIFPLPAPRACGIDPTDPYCDCIAEEFEHDNAQCEFGNSPNAGVQRYGKAYPSTRQLETLRMVGDQAVVTSVCPKDVAPEGEPHGPAHGYNPNMAALVGRMKDWFGTLCLPRPLVTDAQGQIPCRISEVSFDSCDCSAPGRSPATSSDLMRIKDHLEDNGYCGDLVGVSCDSACACELDQLEGGELDACQNQVVNPGNFYGFCYVDPGNGAGSNPALVEGCAANQKRLVRFIGDGVPAADRPTVMICDVE